MRAYFLRRLLLIPPTLIGVTLVVFILTRLVPGGPVEALLAQMQGSMQQGPGGGGTMAGRKQALDEDQLEQLKEFYNLDDNNYLRAYLKWLGVWPSDVGRKKLEFQPEETQQTIRTAQTRERLVVHRERPGVFRLTTPDGGDPGPWKVRSLGLKKLPEPGPGDPPPPQIERAEVYRTQFTGLLTGNLGRSTRYQDPVVSMIAERLPVSTYYGVMTLIISYLISIPLGIWKALNHRSLGDNLTSALVFAGYAVPSFALGALLVIWVAVRWDLLPAGGFTSPDFADKSFIGQILDIASHSVLPLTCYTIGSFAFLTMLMKNELMENVAADYIRTAVAKGLSYSQAVRRHALRNAFIPIATNLGSVTTAIVAGSFLIERVFDINGFGLLFLESVLDRDYPVVMGTTLLTAFLIMLGNILSDVFVALTDPRVKFE